MKNKLKHYFFIFIASLGVYTSMSAKKEIEIKMKLTPEQVTCLENLLAKCADQRNQKKVVTVTRIDQTTETDYYLNNPQNSFFFRSNQGFIDALGSLRIRCTPQEDFLCYKYRHLDPVTGKTLYRDEYDVPVDNGETILQIFTSLGFTEQIIITKNRTVYHCENFAISIDKVDGCGTFVEVELKKEVDDVKFGLSLITDLLRKIGITSWQEVDRSYFHMKLNPDYNFCEEKRL